MSNIGTEYATSIAHPLIKYFAGAYCSNDDFVKAVHLTPRSLTAQLVVSIRYALAHIIGMPPERFLPTTAGDTLQQMVCQSRYLNAMTHFGWRRRSTKQLAESALIVATRDHLAGLFNDSLAPLHNTASSAVRLLSLPKTELLSAGVLRLMPCLEYNAQRLEMMISQEITSGTVPWHTIATRWIRVVTMAIPWKAIGERRQHFIREHLGVYVTDCEVLQQLHIEPSTAAAILAINIRRLLALECSIAPERLSMDEPVRHLDSFNEGFGERELLFGDLVVFWTGMYPKLDEAEQALLTHRPTDTLRSWIERCLLSPALARHFEAAVV